MAEGDLLGCCGCAGLEAALYLAGGLGGRPEELGEAGPDAAVPLLDEEGASPSPPPCVATPPSREDVPAEALTSSRQGLPPGAPATTAGCQPTRRTSTAPLWWEHVLVLVQLLAVLVHGPAS